MQSFSIELNGFSIIAQPAHNWNVLGHGSGRSLICTIHRLTSVRLLFKVLVHWAWVLLTCRWSLVGFEPRPSWAQVWYKLTKFELGASAKSLGLIRDRGKVSFKANYWFSFEKPVCILGQWMRWSSKVYHLSQFSPLFSAKGCTNLKTTAEMHLGNSGKK